MKLGKRCDSKCTCVCGIDMHKVEKVREKTHKHMLVVWFTRNHLQSHARNSIVADRGWTTGTDLVTSPRSQLECVRVLERRERHGFRTLDGVVRECVLVVQRERLSEIWGKFPARVRSAVRLRVEGRGIVVLVVMHTGTFSRFWIHRSRGARFFRWKSLLKERG